MNRAIGSGSAMAEPASPLFFPQFFQLKDQISRDLFAFTKHLSTHSSVNASPKICFNSLKEPLITLDPVYVQRT